MDTYIKPDATAMQQLQVMQCKWMPTTNKSDFFWNENLSWDATRLHAFFCIQQETLSTWMPCKGTDCVSINEIGLWIPNKYFNIAMARCAKYNVHAMLVFQHLHVEMQLKMGSMAKVKEILTAFPYLFNVELMCFRHVRVYIEDLFSGRKVWSCPFTNNRFRIYGLFLLSRKCGAQKCLSGCVVWVL